METPAKHIEANIFFLIVGFMLAFGIYQTLGTSLNTDTPVVTVVSDSMEPTFYRGDILLVRGTTWENIQAGRENGTIIVYESEYLSIPLIHRVIEKHNNSLETKGDNNRQQVRVCLNYAKQQASDPPCSATETEINIENNVTQDQILGKSSIIIPKLGYAKLLPTCLFYKTTLPDNHPNVQNTCQGL